MQVLASAASDCVPKPVVTAWKDEAHAAFQEAIDNVAELSAVSRAGGLIHTISG